MKRPPETPPQPTAGYFRSGLPYSRLGRGPRPLVVVQGLTFENKPQPGLATAMYRFLGQDYTVFSVLRRPGLPQGYTLADMAADYAAMIREEFGGPVDVIGVSTGGSIVQPLAADYPDVVRRLASFQRAPAERPGQGGAVGGGAPGGAAPLAGGLGGSAALHAGPKPASTRAGRAGVDDSVP
jgi:pimeloyl-ACP methyl ester carboxylesterase